uniref:non-specific serine/threonine protein kinase n=1 Tax=Globodera rostochiensis TaxID=31243 RepID=A0A914HAA0_GLORO
METLLDALVCLYDECCNSTLRKEKSIAEFVEYAKPIVARVKALRLCRDDFEVLKVIGRGSFGEVAVVRLANTDKIYAMKILNKWEMLKRAETACFKEERDVMVFGDRQWITNLHYAFQDEKNLYLVMDYYVGGDLLTLLSKFEEEHGHVPEHMAKFYVAEMILAIDSVHRLGYVHRDIKPDNVLLDITGHIKLGDFGSCLRRQADGTVSATTAVGTPDYISPETLRAVEDGRGRYGAECDWWSLGICMYEMIFGETPFYAESLVDTYGKIMNHEEMFEFPEEIDISDDAKDLISRLICAREMRLGKNGLDDFRGHPFFAGIDWTQLRTAEAPYKPEVSSPTDTSNFDTSVVANDFTPCETQPPKVTAPFTGLHLPFIGFTYTSGSVFSDATSLLETIQNGLRPVLLLDASASSVLGQQQQRIGVLPRLPSLTDPKPSEQQQPAEEDDEREAPPREPQPPLPESPAHQDQLVAQLKDEIQILRKRLEDEQSQRPTKQAGVEELEKKCKEVKEKNQQLILQKQDLQKEVEELLEKAQTQSREWKSALKQRDVALQDYEETNTELAETRSRLTKAESSLRDQEHRARQFEEKCDIYKAELRAALASRAEGDARLTALEKELEEERAAKALVESKLLKLDNSTQQQQQQLGTEEPLKMDDDVVGTSEMKEDNDDAGVGNGMEAAAAAAAAQSLEEQRQRFQEALQSEEMRRHELAEHWQKQVADMQRLVDEQQQRVQQQRNENEEDKLLWSKQHQEHMLNVEKLYGARMKTMECECADVRAENEQLRTENSRLEQELLCQQRMSAQIQEIVQFVSDGKERQELLQDVTTRLAGELECFKRQQQQHIGGGQSTAAATPSQYQQQNSRDGSYANTPVNDSPLRTWGSRRMNKQAKYGRFEAQQQLDAEMRAKRQAQDELREVREQKDRLEHELEEYRRKLRQQQEEMERMNQENASLLRQQHWAMRNWAPQRGDGGSAAAAAAAAAAAVLIDTSSGGAGGGGAPPSSSSVVSGGVVSNLMEQTIAQQHRFNANFFNRSFSSSSNSPSAPAVAPVGGGGAGAIVSQQPCPTATTTMASSSRSPAANYVLDEYEPPSVLNYSRSPALMNQSFASAAVSPPQHQHQHQQFPFHPQFYENARFYTPYAAAAAAASAHHSPMGAAASIMRPSAANPKSIQSLNNAFNGEGHHFVNASLRAPTKCVVCTSVLIGADRQGMYCQECQVACHVGCLNKVPKECPVPNDLRRSDGIDMMRGNGTAYQGAVKTPKNGGVKRGWQTTYVIVCDFKLYLYDCQTDGRHGKIVSIDPQIRQVLDMKDPDFQVSPATENDAIHASKSDLPKIFKVAFSQVHDFHTCAAFPPPPPAVGALSEMMQDEKSMMTVSSHCSSGSQNSSSYTINNNTSATADQLQNSHQQQQQQNALISRQYALLMADTKEEAQKWVIALTELRNLFLRSGLPRKDAFVVRELCDHAALAQLRSAQCAVLIDQGRFVLGLSDQGLISVELDKEIITPVGGEAENKKRNVEQVDYDLEEQLLIALVGVGKERHVRLIPTAALDGRDLKWIKVSETRGCHLLCWGRGHSPRTAPHGAPPGTQHYFACAIQKSVVVFQINRTEKRHARVREMAMPGQPQCLKIAGGRLFVGYPSSFRVWDLLDNSQLSLVNLEDQSLQFLNQILHDAEMVISVHGGGAAAGEHGEDDDAGGGDVQLQHQQQTAKEYLLVFQKLGIYVDGQGRRSRAHELMFPCRLSAVGKFAFRRPFLLHFSEHQICVFNIHTAEWVQTVNLRSARPLNQSGLFTLCQMLDLPHLVLLGMRTPSTEEQQFLPALMANRRQSGAGISAGVDSSGAAGALQPKRRRKFSMRNSKDECNRTDRRSQLPISGPSNFVHVVHMGPGNVVELQNLMDLNTSNSPSASPGGSAGNTAEKARHQFAASNPVIRSTSTSSTSTTTGAPVANKHQQQQQHGHHQQHHHHHHLHQQVASSAAARPQSAQSRNSDVPSTASRSAATTVNPIHQQQQQIDPNDPNGDYYLEPVNSPAFRAKQAQSAAAALLMNNNAPSPPSVPPPKRPNK